MTEPIRCSENLAHEDAVAVLRAYDEAGSSHQQRELFAEALNMIDDCDAGSVFCYVHGRCEVAPPDAYRTCGECMHVYVTPRELEDAYHRVALEVHGMGASRRPADQIDFCQHCMHSF